MGKDVSSQIQTIEARIGTLTDALTRAKNDLEQWSQAGATLSLSAAQTRANNQSKGRGALVSLLGPGFKRAVRADAVSANAKLAQEVAEKRIKIAQGKENAKYAIRTIQADLASAKEELRSLRKHSVHNETPRVFSKADEITKLAALRDQGILTENEFQIEKKALLSGPATQSFSQEALTSSASFSPSERQRTVTLELPLSARFGKCEQCKSKVPIESKKCPVCKVSFSPLSGWKLQPTS